MEEMVKLISSYGVSFVIVAIFLWDYVVNKKSMRESIDVIKDTNINISKTLELLQRQMETTDKKIDKLLERK